MRSTEATSVIDIPLPAAQAGIRDVESWPRWLEDVRSVTKTSHERYRFRSADGRVAPFVVRLDAREHRVTWHSLSGPARGGSLRLHPVDENRTRVVLSVTYHPVGTMAVLLDMIAPQRPTARTDLQRLEAQLRASSGRSRQE